MTRYCACGWIAASDLSTCGHYMCALHELGFGALVLVRGDGGWRHYLHDEAVHCGQGLILQPQFEHSDPSTRPVRVRYECALTSELPPPALFYVEIAGHLALITEHAGMQLRWPHWNRR